MKRDFLGVLDAEKDFVAMIELAANLKNRARAGELYEPLKNKNLAMIFEKASTRTRVSFEVAMGQLGGHALYLNPQDLQLGRGETIADTARVLSRYVDAIVYRAYRHADVLELAKWTTIPVINGLDDWEHPCQALADFFTIHEHKGDLKGLKLAYVGDGNNVCHSLLLAGAVVGLHVSVGCPDKFRPNTAVVKQAKELAAKTDAKITILPDPVDAVKDADVVYTDVWVSMGMEKEKTERERILLPYQVNQLLVNKAKEDAIVMHCLPAHRGLEITDEVIDGPKSVVWDQAENRLHAQKALLVTLLGAA
ncbi:MAG TPA: ornithine carbamoyltransferase [Thermoplasmata archaeon]|nr:ornithine carbamoyltransferase [Thermoplasmata archaeon]